MNLVRFWFFYTVDDDIWCTEKYLSVTKKLLATLDKRRGSKVTCHKGSSYELICIHTEQNKVLPYIF